MERRETIDEALESIWLLKEMGILKKDVLVSSLKERGINISIEELIKEGLIDLEGDVIIFKPDAHSRAEHLVRLHRLTEQLFHTVLQVSESEAEETACHMEHMISSDVEDSICTFLGHPPICPHGKPIPKGACCAKLTKEVEPLVSRLEDLSPGDSARIVFIATRHHARLERLSALGILPGTTIRLHQKSPSFVIRVGETDIALDRSLVSEIYVKRT